jgi:predicted nucleotidyltransferase
MEQRLIMKCLFGSHLYKLNTENSDKDYKGIYLPKLDELLLGQCKKSYYHSTGNDGSKNTSEDIDTEIYSLPYFIELACKGETVTIDMLHSDLANVQSCAQEHQEYNEWAINIWKDLYDNRTKFYTKDMRSYVGYARKQAAKYGVKGSRLAAVERVVNFLTHSYTEEQRVTLKVKDVIKRLPTNEHVQIVQMLDTKQGDLTFYEVCTRKFQDSLTLKSLLEACQRIYDEYGDRAKMAKIDLGVDWKAVSHALRASYQVLGILKDGDFEYPLPQSEFLLATKKGQLNFVNEVQPELEHLMEEIEALCKISKLPERVDKDYWEAWLLKTYRDYLL